MMFARKLMVCFALVAIAGFVGCSGKPADKPAAKGGHDHDHAHGHESGPHKGSLVVLGDEEYHAEVVHNDETHEVTIYLLDGKVEKAVPVELTELAIRGKVGTETKEFKLPAAPLEGETGGKTSRFSLKDEKLAEAVDTKGSTFNFNLKIGTKPYSATFKGGDEHDHADEKADAKDAKPKG